MAVNLPELTPELLETLKNYYPTPEEWRLFVDEGMNLVQLELPALASFIEDQIKIIDPEQAIDVRIGIYSVLGAIAYQNTLNDRPRAIRGPLNPLG